MSGVLCNCVGSTPSKDIEALENVKRFTLCKNWSLDHNLPVVFMVTDASPLTLRRSNARLEHLFKIVTIQVM
jgi:hypothetical protein